LQLENPIWYLGWLTVVMAGLTMEAISTLSNPVTIISRGTFRPIREQDFITAAA
jgi:hypothetical protein